MRKKFREGRKKRVQRGNGQSAVGSGRNRWIQGADGLGFGGEPFAHLPIRLPASPLKAISLKEPWVTLIATGEKTIETRVWCTKHRGPLLIVGSQKPVGEFAGKAACVVDVLDCREMTVEDEAEACIELYPRAKAWIIDNLRLVKPFHVKGQLGIYDVDDALIEYLED